jgi:uncharacterized repeat protein (TIGR03803 family)
MKGFSCSAATRLGCIAALVLLACQSHAQTQGTKYSFKIIYDFGKITNQYGSTYDDAYPASQLTISDDGKKLYGITSGGIFSVDISSGIKTGLYNFGTTTNDGVTPIGRLALSQDGLTLYGATVRGGTYNLGTVFEIGTHGENYQILHDFSLAKPPGESTYPSSGLTLSPDGKTLYGAAEGFSEGVAAGGNVYSVNINSGAVVTLAFNYDFEDYWNQQGYGTVSQGVNISPDGGTIYGLFYSPSTLYKQYNPYRYPFNLYGVFSIKNVPFGAYVTNNAGYLSITNKATNWNLPYSSSPKPSTNAMVLSPDGKTLYGNGRFEAGWAVYSIDTKSGSNNIIYNFGSVTNDTLIPQSPLAISTDGKSLYGTTLLQTSWLWSSSVFSVNIITGKEEILYRF